MRVSLIASGSRGDVQPVVALAAALNQRGHQADVVAFDEFAPLAADHGVSLKPFSMDIRAEMESARSRDFFARGGNPLQFMRWFLDLGRRFARTTTAEIRDYTEGADLIVGAGLSDPVAAAVARARRLPYVHAYLQPQLPNREYPTAIHAGYGAALPGWLNRLEQEMVAQLLWLGVRSLIGISHEILGLKPPPFRSDVLQAVRRGEPFLMGYSPQVAPRSRDWPASVHVTGYWFLDAPTAWRPPADLVAFLEAGAPPVYVGFGSMGLRDAEETLRVVFAAIERAGCRAIVSKGWGGLGDERPLPDHVFAIDDIPHDWLLPRMAAAVHHGGAGTTAAAIRAGVPSVVTPFLTDQFFWGWRAQTLGVAPRAIPHRQLTADNLAGALSAVLTDESLRSRAAELGGRVRAESGATRACEAIEEASAVFGRGKA